MWRRCTAHTTFLLLPSKLQALNVAVIKATTNQFHVVPKEKHVRCEWRAALGCHSSFGG